MIAQVATEPPLDKAQILDGIGKLPEKAFADALIEHIMFMQSIANGVEQTASGNATLHEQAMLEIRSWRKF